MRDMIRRCTLAATLLAGLAGTATWTSTALAAKPGCSCPKVIVQDGVRCILDSCGMIDCTYLCRV